MSSTHKTIIIDTELSQIIIEQISDTIPCTEYN